MPQLFILMTGNIFISRAITFLVGTTITKVGLKCRYFDQMVYTRGRFILVKVGL